MSAKGEFRFRLRVHVQMARLLSVPLYVLANSTGTQGQFGEPV